MTLSQFVGGVLAGDLRLTDTKPIWPPEPQLVEVVEAMWQLENRGVAVDLLTVSAEMKARGTLDGVGGNRFLAQLQDAYLASLN